MSIKRVGGVAGTHRLDGPGQYGGATVVNATTVGKITILTGNTLLGTIAAGSSVGTSAAGGAANSGPSNQFDGLSINFASAVDFIDLNYAGPYG